MLSTCKFYSVRQILTWLLLHTFPTSPMRERKVRTCRLPFFGFDEGSGRHREEVRLDVVYLLFWQLCISLAPLLTTQLHHTADDCRWWLFLPLAFRQREKDREAADSPPARFTLCCSFHLDSRKALTPSCIFLLNSASTSVRNKAHRIFWHWMLISGEFLLHRPFAF